MVDNYPNGCFKELQNAVDVSSYATTSLSSALKQCVNSDNSAFSFNDSTTLTSDGNNYSDFTYLDNSIQFIDTGYEIDNNCKIVFKNGHYVLSIDGDNSSEQKGEEKEMLKVIDPVIVSYEIIKPDKVVKVTFNDEGTEKMVCHEDDVFDLRKCLFIAIAKHLYKNEYTWEGIEYMAQQISYKKMYVKIVDKAIKEHNKAEKERLKEEKDEEIKKNALANKKRKHARYVERRKQRRLNEQAKAVCEGLKMYDKCQEEKARIAREEYCDANCERC